VYLIIVKLDIVVRTGQRSQGEESIPALALYSSTREFVS
jgi:hypothetical protein